MEKQHTHSPLPKLKLEQEHYIEKSGIGRVQNFHKVVDEYGLTFALVPPTINADILLRSVNSHSQLVEALERVRQYVANAPAKDQAEVGVRTLNIMIIDDALAVAKGDPEACTAYPTKAPIKNSVIVEALEEARPYMDQLYNVVSTKSEGYDRIRQTINKIDAALAAAKGGQA